jgi:hypothetical protein
MTFEDQWKKAFPGPYEYHPEGTLIADKEGNLILDVRGWGRLTGEGTGGLGLANAEAVQDWFGEWLADLLNYKLPAIKHLPCRGCGKEMEAEQDVVSVLCSLCVNKERESSK